MARLLWTQKQDFGPFPRLSHGLAFDSNRSRVVLFGGETAVGPPTVLIGDTWEGMARTGRRWKTSAPARESGSLWLMTALATGWCCSEA